MNNNTLANETTEQGNAMDDLKKHIQQQLEDRKENEQMIAALEAIGSSATILETLEKERMLTSAIQFLEQEGLPVLDEYARKTKEYEATVETLKGTLPEQIDEALSKMTRDDLLRFIDTAMSYQKNEEFRYMVKSFSDDQRDTVYELIHSEPITDKDHENLIWRFETLMGYSMRIVDEEVLKDLHPTLEPYREFIRKYVRKPDGKTKIQLEQMKTWKNFNLSETMIKRYAEAVVHRFGISELGEETAKQAFEEFSKILVRQQSAQS